MNLRKKEVVSAATSLALFASVSIAAVMVGVNYQVLVALFGSGGGKTASSSYGTEGVMGQGISGKGESASYKADSGFMPQVEAVRTPAASNLSNAHAYPSPYKPSVHSNGITFSALTSQCTIKVYTISGELVNTLEKEEDPYKDNLNWNPVVNSGNESLASGVYIFYIENSREHKTGKFAIIK